MLSHATTLPPGVISGLVIRRGESDLVPVVARFERFLCDGEGYPESALRQFFEIDSDGFAVAFHEDRPVGYIVGLRRPGSNVGLVVSLGVAYEYRRQGVARDLLQNEITRQLSYDVAALDISVDPENAAAMAFLRANEFIEIADVHDYFGNGRDRLIMQHMMPSHAISPLDNRPVRVKTVSPERFAELRRLDCIDLRIAFDGIGADVVTCDGDEGTRLIA